MKMGVVHILLQIVLVGVVLGEPAGLLQANVPGNVNPSVLNRQQGGLSFVIPGLSLLGGNNGIGGGNLFGTVTVTRTVVSTGRIAFFNISLCPVSTSTVICLFESSQHSDNS